MSAMAYGSVCSGIESASVAWAPLGWEPAWFAEIDPFPSAVLSHRHPEVPNRGDFTKIHADVRPGSIRLLVGGTPCQSFSVAGLRKGLADPRGNLALEFLRLADAARPEWVVWENVPGVLSSGGGRDFGSFLGALGQLGYGWSYRVLDAQYVRVDLLGRAVPQRRRRVFVVGHLGDWRPAVAVLFDRESLSGHPAPRRQAGQGTSPDASPCLRARSQSSHRADTEAYVAESLMAHHGRSRPDETFVPLAFGGNNTTGPIDVATACNAASSASGRLDFESETFVAHTLKADGFDASEDGTGRGVPLVPVAFAWQGGGKQTSIGFDPPPRTCQTLGADQTPAVAFQCQGTNVSADDEIAGTFRGGNGHLTGGGPCVATRWAVRRLTPYECELLQGFPGHYTLIPMPRGKGKKRKPRDHEETVAYLMGHGFSRSDAEDLSRTPDGPRYRALGNAMAVNCMRWIGKRIDMVQAILKARAA